MHDANMKVGTTSLSTCTCQDIGLLNWYNIGERHASVSLHTPAVVGVALDGPELSLSGTLGSVSAVGTGGSTGGPSGLQSVKTRGVRLLGEADRGGTVVLTAQLILLAIPTPTTGLPGLDTGDAAGIRTPSKTGGGVDVRDAMRLHASVATPIVAAFEGGVAVRVEQAVGDTVGSGVSTDSRAGEKLVIILI